MALSHTALIKKEFIVENDGLTSSQSSMPHDFKTKRKHEKVANKAVGPGKVCPFVIPSYPSKFSETESSTDRCPYLSDGCRYSHDLETALADRLPDLPGHCPILRATGCCNAGPLCRWQKGHVPEALPTSPQPTAETHLNAMGSELRSVLYKHQYCFKRADEFLDSLNASKVNGNRMSGKTLGHVTDEDVIKIRPSEKKLIDFSDKLYLAPLTTVGNLPFRRVCKRFGADITCGEMAVAGNILKGKQSEWALLRRHCSENLFGVQLCGSQVDTMVRAAQLIEDNCQIDFVDINCGCPIDLIWKKGAGAGLMKHASRLESIVRGCDQVLQRAVVTVKMRSGVKEGKNTAHQLISGLQRAGAALITLHGRSREQRYTRLADWDYIKQCVQVAEPNVIFGSGDVLSYDDYVRSKEVSGVSGIMLGRGALIKPWIFTEIHESRNWDISSAERLDMLRDFTNYGLELWGSDARGVETTRRFLLEWLSFLYRYIPYGLLERPPQRINERPPSYFGRNDLETLMASPKSTDWIRITEMLLGPVPDEFSFTPKHRANAY